jgi:ankyrin repeat protein
MAAYAQHVVQHLDAGVDVNARDWDNRTAAMAAAARGHLAVLKLLRERGADLEAADHTSTTPLMEAAMRGHLRVVEYLLDSGGVSIDTRSTLGVTALWLAAGMGRFSFLASPALLCVVVFPSRRGPR